MTADDSSVEGPPVQPGMFTTTHWSVVLAAGQENDTTKARVALNKLCRTYWYPLYAYVRRRGNAEQEAEDLIQGFFAVLLKRQALQNVTQGRGKFRSFLLTALNHFLSDEHDWQHAQKRGGGQPVISLDAQGAEERYRLEPPDTETPEKLFERRWAMTLIDGAMDRLRQAFAAEQKTALFDQLRGFIVDGADTRTYAQVAAQVGMTEEAVKKAVQRLRRRYQDAIREEIAQTVASPAEVEEELRHLVSVLSSGR